MKKRERTKLIFAFMRLSTTAPPPLPVHFLIYLNHRRRRCRHGRLASCRTQAGCAGLRFEHASISVSPQMLPRPDWDHKRGSRGSQVSAVHRENRHRETQTVAAFTRTLASCLRSGFISISCCLLFCFCLCMEISYPQISEAGIKV